MSTDGGELRRTNRSAWRLERHLFRYNSNLISERQGQAVVLRRLPEADAHPGTVRDIQDGILYLELGEEPGSPLVPGVLVEVAGDQVLYLGEVYSGAGKSITIGIEHAVEREALATIQRAWKTLGRSRG